MKTEKNYKKERVTRAPLHPFEVEELACKILGLDYDEIDANATIIENELIEQFNCDFDQFMEIVARLMPLIDFGSSPLTKERYKGFSDVENSAWYVKMLVPEK
jgi:hypothetical protein